MNFLLRALIFAFATYFIFKLLRKLIGKALNPLPPAKTAPKTAALPQAMIACDQCGLYIPRAEALAQDGKHYCSTQHAEQNRA